MANPYDPQSGYPVPSNGVPDPYGAHQSGAYPPPYPGVPPVGGYGVPPASNMGWGPWSQSTWLPGMAAAHSHAWISAGTAS